MKLWDRILEFIPGKSATTARYVILAVAVGILFLWSGDLFGLVTVRPAPEAPTAVAATEPVTQDELTRWESLQAAELKAVLGRIQGAGNVDVSVSLESGPVIELGKDTVVEKTTSNEIASDKSTRDTQTVTERDTHLLQRGGSADQPVVTKRSRPVIAGVIVVAEGAWNAEVRARLLDAVRTKLGVSANRIQVYPAGRDGL